MEPFKKLTQQLTQYIQENENFQKNNKEETFKDDQTKNEDELISQAENILHRLIEKKQSLDKIVDLEKEIEPILKIFEKEMNKHPKWNEEDKKTVENINSLIDTMKLIKFRKVGKETGKNPKRARVFKAIYDCDVDELEELRQTYDEERYKQKERKMDMKEYLAELCEMEIKEVLFDSNIHNWSKNNNEFGTKLKGHRNVCILIEDTNENIFGGYCSKEIGIFKYHYDSKSFIFSLKKEGKYTMKKYPLKEGSYDLKISFDSSDFLFNFGSEDKDNSNYLRDISVFKKDSPKKSYCKQYSYDYGEEINALCTDNNNFDVKRIVVYEMEETKEMKEQREKEEQQERASDLLRRNNEKEEVERRICEMTGKQIDGIIFDSEVNKWKIGNSDFGNIIQGKKEVLVLIEDERQNLFGGYIGNEIVINQNVNDETCYVFSLRKNGQFETKRYERNKNGFSYWIPNDSDINLMVFGTNNEKLCKDITIYKEDYSSGYCRQDCYDYHGEQFALRGRYYFDNKRIVVYHLK